MYFIAINTRAVVRKLRQTIYIFSSVNINIHIEKNPKIIMQSPYFFGQMFFIRDSTKQVHGRDTRRKHKLGEKKHSLNFRYT